MVFEFQPLEWLHLFLRWVHVIAGIMWIGDSLYFMWLDKSLKKPDGARESLIGETWMVHGGGFYKVEKMYLGPGELPEKLHWFKWQSYSTWISGFFLLCVVYYLSGGGFLLDSQVSDLSYGQAVGLGLGLLVGGWLFYDLVFMPLLDKLPERLGFISPLVSILLLAAVSFGLTQLLSGRAAFIHIGAMLGTFMTGNVFFRIIPPQRLMVAASQSGEEVDRALGHAAKKRSTHNSYMTFPLIFIMISNHYPATYGHHFAWVILMLFMLFGIGIRHYTLVTDQRSKWVLAGTLATLLALLALMGMRPAPTHAAVQARPQAQAAVSFASVQAIITSRCVACHASQPVDNTFGPNPGGANFESPENIKALAERIYFRAVTTQTMPLANKTGITDQERAVLGQWYQGLGKSE